jgi:hypothetical protein
LTRWSLDRLSAYLGEHGAVISAIRIWRLRAEAGLSFQRTRSWKAGPDPDYEAKAARVLELYAAAPFDGPVISLDRGPDPRRMSRRTAPAGVGRGAPPAGETKAAPKMA